jgi:hypothetical protein
LSVLKVSYNDLLAAPESGCWCIAAFLDRVPDAGAMCSAIDVSLYRNRAAATAG